MAAAAAAVAVPAVGPSAVTATNGNVGYVAPTPSPLLGTSRASHARDATQTWRSSAACAAATLTGAFVVTASHARRRRIAGRSCQTIVAAINQGAAQNFFKLEVRGVRAPGRPRSRRPQASEVTCDGEDGRSYFHMGGNTPRVPFDMHRRHRERLVERLRLDSTRCEGLDSTPMRRLGTVVLLEGGSELSVYDTDTVWDFKQESNFQWLFGVREPGCFAAISVDTGKAILFVPRLPEDYEAWMGPRRTAEWFRATYEVDAVFFVDEIAEVLRSELVAERLLVYYGRNRDSGLSLKAPRFDRLEEFDVMLDSRLWDALAECRVIKDDEEQRILQFVNDVSSDAHVAVMRGVEPGTPEYVSEAEFKHYAFLRGCARVGYSCICPSGGRCAVLHYGHAAFPNAEEVQAGEMKLHDMGAEYHCYTADVTCTFPVDGVFTDAQRVVYEAVWEATLAVERTMKPGISNRDMHLLAERTLMECMVKAGLFKGSIDAMQDAHLMSIFMPHGLGHGLGLDVHDVGGYLPGENRQDDPRVEQNLRCGRELIEGMVLTVEPGFYFVDYLIRRALATPELSKFIVPERLEELCVVGGVRIEDDVVVTSTGCRVLTRIPRTVAEIEAVMAGAPWEAKDQPLREYVGEA